MRVRALIAQRCRINASNPENRAMAQPYAEDLCHNPGPPVDQLLRLHEQILCGTVTCKIVNGKEKDTSR